MNIKNYESEKTKYAIIVTVFSPYSMNASLFYPNATPPFGFYHHYLSIQIYLAFFPSTIDL